MVSVKNFQFVSGKIIELVTFEIKTEDGKGVPSVFETAAQSRVANKSYLAIHCPKKISEDSETDELLERIESECERFEVGLILFEDPDDWETYEERVEAVHHNPDPELMNGFITQQFPEDKKSQIAKIIK